MEMILKDYFVSVIGEDKLENRVTTPQIRIDYSRHLMLGGLEYFTGHQVEWLNGYDLIADWLRYNKGMSIVVTGPYGVGKTILCMHVIPTLIARFHGIYCEKFRATELCNEGNYRKAMKTKYIVVDDVGTEGQFVDFGNRHEVFSEIVDGIEQQGKLVIASTNLVPKELQKRYGERTFDRLRANATLVCILSNSLRGKYKKVE